MFWYGHGFWFFILGMSAVWAVAGIFRGYQREKTIRSAIEKGATLDPATLAHLNSRSPGDARGGLLTGAIVTFFVGCGLMVMAYLIDFEHGHVIYPLIGVGGLLWCIGLGLFVSRLAIRSPRE